MELRDTALMMASADYKERFKAEYYQVKNTSLPDNPDYKKIKDFVVSVNERIVKNEI